MREEVEKILVPDDNCLKLPTHCSSCIQDFEYDNVSDMHCCTHMEWQKAVTDQILTLLDKEIQKARVEELERLKNEYTQYAWARNPANLPGLANPFRLVDDRIKQLEGEK